MNADIVIPTCRTPDEVAGLMAEIRATAPGARVTATCLPACAAANRNAGLEWAQTPNVIMVDDDIRELDPGWNVRLEEVLESNPDNLVVSANLVNADWSLGPMLGHPPGREGTGVVETPLRELPTACICMRANGLRFDEGFEGSGWEDTDFSRQLRTLYPRGRFLVACDVRVVHLNEKKNQGGEIFVRNRARYRAKWGERIVSARPFIGLCKARSGGEWLEAALRPVGEVCDGVVFLRSERPWSPAVELADDCGPAISEFMSRGTPKAVEHRGDWRDQGVQYRDGLAAIRDLWGEKAAVFVFDSDELWAADDLRALRKAALAAKPDAVLLAGMWTYLRSPLYRVHPPEPAQPVVALGSAADREVDRRFMATRLRVSTGLRFHHMSYVRRDEDALRNKFLSVASQEKHPSDYTWWDRVWPNLPRGENLHMTVDEERAWKRVRVSLPSELPPGLQTDETVLASIAAEDARWRDVLRSTPPEQAMVPTPDWDRGAYDKALATLVGSKPKQVRAQTFQARLKSTNYEALVLAELARGAQEIAEVGSGTGGSMLCFALGNPKAQLTCVDPFVPYDEETAGGLMRDVREGNRSQFEKAVAAFKLGGRVRLIAKPSAVAQAEVADGSLDLVFVDGNHSPWAVALDLRFWWAKLRPGGIMIGHDYTTRFPGVVSATDTWERWCGAAVRTWQGTSLFSAVKP